ncbi:hypothetical protein RCL1_003028 [Eukaryota sp. TZLM3-RCL]
MLTCLSDNLLINNTETKLGVLLFSDLPYFIVSQTGTFGSFATVNSSVSKIPADLPEVTSNVVVDVRVILGRRDDDLLHLFCRRLADLLLRFDLKSFVVSFAVKGSINRYDMMSILSVLEHLYTSSLDSSRM